MHSRVNAWFLCIIEIRSSNNPRLDSDLE